MSNNLHTEPVATDPLFDIYRMLMRRRRKRRHANQSRHLRQSQRGR